jgi:hypothetical protein
MESGELTILQLGDAFERDLKCKRLCAWRSAEWGWAQSQQNGQSLGGQGSHTLA